MVNILIGIIFLTILGGISYGLGLAVYIFDKDMKGDTVEEVMKNESFSELLATGFFVLIVILIVLAMLWALGFLIKLGM